MTPEVRVRRHVRQQDTVFAPHATVPKAPAPRSVNWSPVEGFADKFERHWPNGDYGQVTRFGRNTYRWFVILRDGEQHRGLAEGNVVDGIDAAEASRA